VAEEEIARLISEGEIRPTSYVREESDAEWTEARQTSLSRYFESRDLKRAAKEEAIRQRGPREHRFGGLISLVIAALIAGAVWWGATGGFNRFVEGTPVEAYVPAALLSDEALAQRMEAQFEHQKIYRSLRTFERMKTLFPEEYHSLMRELVPLYRRNATPQESAVIAQRHMADFLHRNQATMLRASPEAMIAILNAETGMIRALQSRDLSLCSTVIDGSASASAVGSVLMATNRAELDAMNLALFEAIKSGETANNAYAPLTPEDWVEVGRSLLRTGADTQLLQQFGENPAGMSAADKCSAAVQIFTIMNEEPDLTLRARYGAEIIRNM
jgi:hypothetical protein